ncbi:MAG: aldo/keto reductase [Solobacterium sp.]|nr:aldo/keto reductase [Solobacterium sp.]
MKKVLLKDGTPVPALGQGTWYMGEKRSLRESEIESLRWGIEHGMNLIDTAEMYGDGASEKLIGDAIVPFDREKLFIVSKVYPWNAGRRNIFDSCEASLERLGTDYLDLYLLHWRGSVPLRETVQCMEELIKQGKILRWGVSNLDDSDMKELSAVPGGLNCQCDQVLYHLGSRGAEAKLLPWLKEHDMPMMAYCPLAQAGKLRSSMLRDPVLNEIAHAHNATVFQIMLAFAIRDYHVFAVPKAGTLKHVQENREAAEIELSEEEKDLLNNAFPKPAHVYGLDMV